MSESPSPRFGLLTNLLGAAFAGALAGIVVGLFDTRLTIKQLGFSGDTVFILLQTVGRCGLAGMMLSVGAFLAARFGERAARRLGVGEKRHLLARAVGVALIVLPGCIFVAVRLFQGGYTSRLPARFWLTVATVVVLFVIVLAAARVTIGLMRRRERREGVSILSIVAAVALVGLALIAHFFDAYYYRRLYLYLHGVLGVITLSSLVVAVRLTLVRLELPRASLSRGRLITVIAILAAFVAAHLTFNARQTVKVAAFENTATTANLLHAFSRPTSSTCRGQPSKEIIALRAERERKARIAASGDYPVFPGAHVLLVTVDALRADRLGIYGNSERDLTPHIDAWAKQKGTIFDRAYCTAPHSSYSISSLHTSRYIHDDVMLKKDISFPSMAEVLIENGYQTVGFYTNGIFFTEGDKVGHYRRSKFGIQKVYHGAPPPDEVTDRAIAEIDRSVLKGEPPTFLWVHYFNVHEPYNSTTYGTEPADRYDGEISIVDPEVARLLAHAEKVWKKGVVVAFAADHGEEFKDHGGYYHGSSLYDEQVRVPLVFSVPNGDPKRVEAPVSTAGVARTLLKLVGVMPAATMIGQDLRPGIFKGDEGHVAEPVFAAVVNQHMVLRWPWKLIYDATSQRFELYDIAADPGEKFNVYDKKPALAKELTDEINGWLLEMSKGENPYRTALNLGHLRDPRAVPGLMTLLADTDAPVRERIEAAELLGNIRAHAAVPVLKAVLEDPNDDVAMQAAFTLGIMGDLSGEYLLQDALFGDDPEKRDRAALVLGRAGDRIATPFLVDALGRNDMWIRDQATKVLGRLRDPDATPALIEALKQYRLRYLTVLTLGKIGDLRAYDAIMDRLENDNHSDVRGHCIIALGWMEAKAAIPRLLRVLREEPDFRWTTETLVRLDAVGHAPLFGTDIAAGMPALKSGWGKCHAGEKVVEGDYLGRTACETTGPRAEVSFPVNIKGDAELIIRVRHLLEGANITVPLHVFINGKKAHEVSVTSNFVEFRLPCERRWFSPNRNQASISLKLSKYGRLEVDHVLLLAGAEAP